MEDMGEKLEIRNLKLEKDGHPERSEGSQKASPNELQPFAIALLVILHYGRPTFRMTEGAEDLRSG
jgi:hypothetical protein